MMKELNYFWVGDFYGGKQDLLPDFIMRHAGCAALTACDSFIYLTLYKDKKALCPFSDNQLKGKEYAAFFKTVKPYLRPRLMGINRLDIFVSGVKNYLADKKLNDLDVLPWSGDHSLADTQSAICQQIGQGFPVPMLLLRHRDKTFDSYIWHWFLLIGYDTDRNGIFCVNAVTYGSCEWLDLAKLWDTGYERKGGLILLKEKPPLMV